MEPIRDALTTHSYSWRERDISHQVDARHTPATVRGERVIEPISDALSTTLATGGRGEPHSYR